MAYTKVFDNPYPDGWEDLPSEKTPLKASALQEHTDAIEHIEDYLEDYPPDNIMESLTHQADEGFLKRNIVDITKGTSDTTQKINCSSDGIITFTNSNYSAWRVIPNCVVGKTYTLSCDVELTSGSKAFVGGGGVVNTVITNSSRYTQTFVYSDSNAIAFAGASTTSCGKFSNVMIEEGSVAHDYVCYALGNTDLTKDVNDIDASMKMLGWTLPDALKGMNYIDSNGIFHQKIYRVNISDLSINLSGGYYYFVANPSVINADDDVLSNVSCNKIPTIKGADFGTSTLGIAIGTSGSRIYIKDTSVTSVSAFNTKYANTYIYYELATEITKNVDGNEIAPSLKESLSQLSTPQTLNMVNLSGINSVIRKRAKQIGTLCIINALIQVKACSSDNWTQLFQLPSSARPDSNIDFGMTCGATPYSAQGLINTDGIVQIKPPSNILEGTYVTMNVAYTLI